jgi:serine/threonine protein kinase
LLRLIHPATLSTDGRGGEEVDFKTDIYSAGVLAMVMLCLESPSTMAGGDLPALLLSQHSPRKVMHFVLQCLEESPAARPAALEAQRILDNW